MTDGGTSSYWGVVGGGHKLDTAAGSVDILRAVERDRARGSDRRERMDEAVCVTSLHSPTTTR